MSKSPIHHDEESKALARGQASPVESATGSPRSPQPARRRPVDHALTTAWEILDRSVCECGHTESAHVFDPDECHGEGGDACERGCKDFRPVLFTIERAP